MARLYQVGLTVTALDGNAAIFLGHNDPEVSEPAAGVDDERLHLALLHRDDAAVRERPAVRGGRVRARRRDAGVEAGHDVLPGGRGAAGGAGQGAGAGARHGAARVAGAGGDDLVRALRPLVTGYRQWLTEQASRVESDPEIARYAPAGQQAL